MQEWKHNGDEEQGSTLLFTQDTVKDPDGKDSAFSSTAVLAMMQKLSSSSEEVRDHATTVLASMASKGGNMAIRPFVDMLDSEVLKDRLGALWALIHITGKEHSTQEAVATMEAGALPKLSKILRASGLVALEELQNRALVLMTNLADSEKSALQVIFCAPV